MFSVTSEQRGFSVGPQFMWWVETDKRGRRTVWTGSVGSNQCKQEHTRQGQRTHINGVPHSETNAQTGSHVEGADLVVVLVKSFTHSTKCWCAHARMHAAGKSALGKKIVDSVFTHAQMRVHTHTHTQLVICHDISRELLTLSSSIFQGLAAPTTTCHFNTRLTPLHRRHPCYRLPPLAKPPVPHFSFVPPLLSESSHFCITGRWVILE